MVFTETNVLTREDFGASLSHDDRAKLGKAAVLELNSEVFCIGISAVFVTPAAFLCAMDGQLLYNNHINIEDFSEKCKSQK